jgi:AcrR family transcriptional regulator
MIYYYFGSKEGLFIAVLERLYAEMDEAEATLALDESQPLQALQALVRFVLGYYRAHPEFVTLLNSENLHRGEHIAKSRKAREYSSRAIAATARLLQAGAAQGLTRPGLLARDVYLLIAAAGYFHMANRYTLSAFLGERIDTPEAVEAWERYVIDSVLRSIRPDPPTT